MKQHKNALVIGLTGGIASGKTHVAEIVSEICKTVFINTDLISKRQMEDDYVHDAVVNSFGEEILDNEKKIDRNKLGVIVFNDENKLKLLNGITHPYVTEFVEKEIERIKNDGETELILLETALLASVGYDKYCDEVWYIFCPEKDRIERMKKDRGYSLEKIKSILSKQMSEKEYKVNCTRIIDNGDGVSTEEMKCVLKGIIRTIKHNR